MTKLPEGKTRLDLVRAGLADTGLKKRGRLIVNIDRLREDPRNERRTFRNMDGLIASIKAVGLIEPITVTPPESPEAPDAPDGETDSYRIITGHRRYRAAKAAGLQQIEILIREPEDELIRRQKSIVSNVQREDVGPVEMAEALQSMIDEDPRVTSQEDLARMIGKNKSWVSRMLRILDLPSALKQQVASTQLSIAYESIAEIARLEGKTDQARLIGAVLDGASQSQIREEIRHIKGRPSKGREVSSSTPKPKRVFHTNRRATVIVQATSSKLSAADTVAALQEALGQARDGQPLDVGRN